MIISEVMTRDVTIASPDDSLQRAAQIMAKEDFGSLPVAENERLVGMLTDRDIAIRAVARGMVPQHSKVREVMSRALRYVYDDESVPNVARIMGVLHVRRLPVLDRRNRLVGIVSLGDLALAKPTYAGDALQSIAVAPTTVRHGPGLAAAVDDQGVKPAEQVPADPSSVPVRRAVTSTQRVRPMAVNGNLSPLHGLD